MTNPTPPREGRPEWMTRDGVNHAMDCPWVISAGATANMAREILACWDQIAVLRRALEQAREAKNERPIALLLLYKLATSWWADIVSERHCLDADSLSDAMEEASRRWPGAVVSCQSQARETEDDGCYSETAQMAREILACWDQIAVLRRALEQAREAKTERPVASIYRLANSWWVDIGLERHCLDANDLLGAMAEVSRRWPVAVISCQSQARETEDDGC